jgi:hypothetical protein
MTKLKSPKEALEVQSLIELIVAARENGVTKLTFGDLTVELSPPAPTVIDMNKLPGMDAVLAPPAYTDLTGDSWSKLGFADSVKINKSVVPPETSKVEVQVDPIDEALFGQYRDPADDPATI